jgi:putative phosphoribosyl transferase
MSEPADQDMGGVSSLHEAPADAPDPVRFRNRRDAGRRLAALLEPLRAQRPVVLGIPRGGVPVAAEVARALEAPLDVVVVRKLGAPQNPEYAIGALAEGGEHVLSERAVTAVGLSPATLRELIDSTELELRERVRRYRAECEPVDVSGRVAIVVDDGLATGRSAVAAVRSLRARGAARVVLAVPVAAPQSLSTLAREADQVVCVEAPDDMWAVGLWYQDFRPTSDAEVAELLASARAAAPHPGTSTNLAAAQHASRDVSLELGGVALEGSLALPARPRGLVVFAHGSGSGRLSPRNQAVAAALGGAGYATLLFDLLGEREQQERENVFDIALLGSRLLGATRWVEQDAELRALPLAYFGASTGAAAALTAAAEIPERVRAVVSRGGRPDLALDLAAVHAPTLLIVGGADRAVLELNRLAQRQLAGPSRLEIVPGATHLFEEPGTLEQVASLAIGWFDAHLAGGSSQD